MAGANIDSATSLKSVFTGCQEVVGKLKMSDASPSSHEYQELVAKGIDLCERSVDLINRSGLFSENEDADEIITQNIRYLQSSAVMGFLVGLRQTQSPSDRLDLLIKSKEHYEDFIRLLNLYEIDKTDAASILGCPKYTSDVAAQCRRRDEKVKLFKEEKQRQKKLVELEKLIDNDDTDEAVKRDYYLTQLKSWLRLALDELESIRNEIPMLEEMSRRLNNKTESHSNNNGSQNSSGDDRRANNTSHAAGQASPSASSLRSFIIIPDRLRQMKSVFGAGYPSLPVLTLDEWYEQEAAQGRLPQPMTREEIETQKRKLADPGAEEAKAEETRDVETERAIERDDTDALRKAREWDEFKDEHKRGSGNMQNKG